MVSKFERLKKLVEEDAELEVEDLKQKYENKLTAERKATLRLRGENGFMKKKYDAMIKDVNDHKEEIGSLYEKEKELYETIKGLEKDIQGHKKEIREREETIVDKEKRIYDLKKKNQEVSERGGGGELMKTTKPTHPKFFFTPFSLGAAGEVQVRA